MIIAYLIGSIPFGLLIGLNFYHIDIRKIGSGNIGTTNAFRAYGTKGGIAVFILDMLKGGLPVLSGQFIPHITWHPLLFGLAAVIGHIFPIFLSFKGGKAVASSFGLGLFYAPIVAIVGIGVFFISLYFSRIVSLSSILGVFTALIMTFITSDDWILRIMVACLFLLVIIRHKTNIKRILNGTENKISKGFRSKN